MLTGPEQNGKVWKNDREIPPGTGSRRSPDRRSAYPPVAVADAVASQFPTPMRPRKYVLKFRPELTLTPAAPVGMVPLPTKLPTAPAAGMIAPFWLT